ncbi:MAG: endonuclease/exonuclease/phosphatase family protein, partial [Gammaproteobacteria bacterium]
IGAGMDLARGLPIVHVNFAGFDEQSHRRGPNAAFAHWALKGIDAAIARLWRQAMRAERRDYRVWIYSDHGQERVKSYPLVHGQALQAVVEAALETAPSGPRAAPRAEASYRARTLRQAGLPYPQLPPEALADGRPSAAHVAAMGPVGFVYLPTAPDFDTRRRLAERLVAAQVPVVLASMELDRVHAWTADGELLLPQDGERLLGASHPFGAHALADLIDLVRHPGAGDLTVAGWCAGRQPLSFAVENGAHGGFGPRETRGIALTDSSARLPRDAARPLRARDIRQAALTLLGRGDPAACATRPSGDVHAASLRVMTYNTHACLGLDGRALPHRIARVIAECQADIVCLQELDVGRARSDGIDQAERVAAHLTMQHVFHAAVELREERYGNAVLSPLPMRLVQSARLPGIGAREPRGVLWVAIDLGGVELQVINTHLGLRAAERQVQVEFLTSEDWLGAAMQRGPVVMCGDFNAGERSYVWRTLRARLTDVQVENASHAPRNTWFARHPTRRLDHIFVSREFRVVGVDVPRTQLTRVASDHLPVVAELALGVEAVSKASAGAG